ncbi:Pycsar system effector family protein [Polluticaenibacter yanchengensis]|uniref:DUF5706 domain-containing protein n=1 Tax=Polluticaenibacter yanchengensis TaxID=3014562 RepID=A0ABT4UIM7_9BACT|nr:DUF5706 domain-containing protein [Chitinophagaceae bacterium LY-5]
MDFKQLTLDVEKYAQQYFNQNFRPEFLYHNKEHTLSVVVSAEKLGHHYQLSDEDMFVVSAASWFHDLGYFENCQAHEKSSAALARDFLKAKNVDERVIQKVEGCILATIMPQNPKNLLEQIVCDSDFSHFGNLKFIDCNKNLRKELMQRFGKEVDKDVWRKQAEELMEKHRYHTDYANELYAPLKAANLNFIKSKLEESEKEKKTDKEKKDKKEKNNDKPDKGIETMFRITSTNNQRLSDMADRKSNILITVNSILLSAILSLLVRKLDSNTFLIIPTIIILIVAVVTMVYAILATRPKIPDGKFTRDQLANKNVNLMFFGNFYKMSLEEYKHGMLQVMDDKDFLYGSLIRDVYSQGIVLGRKYKLLRIAYNVFMFGVAIAVIAFVISIMSIH